MGDSRPSAPPPAASPLLAACPTCRAVFRGGFQRCPNDGSRLQAGPDDPLVGTVLAGRYQIEAVIGDGGIGRVYRARHVRMSRRFAIKVPFGELAYDRKVRARFANEADAASRLSHPNVIGVVDVGETPEGLFYLAMDLADGTALCDVIARGALDERRATTIFAQIADGLAHAHDRGLIHRDLKPDNVILARGGDGGEQARIVDFGLAIVGHERAGSRLTTEGVVLGTPHYMAPEQATDEDIDYRADLFALGLILFEMLAGCLPFDGTAVEVARQNLGRELPTVAARAQRPVDPLLEGLVRWLTRKQAHERPERTAQVAEIARMLLRGDRDAAAACIPGALPPPAEVELVPLDDGAAEPAEPLAPPPPTSTATVAPAAPPLPAATLAAPPPVATRFDPPAEPRPTEQTAPALRRRRVAIAAVVLALVLGGGAAILSTGGGGTGGAPVATVDAAVAPIAVVEAIDAGVVEVVAVVDEPDAAVEAAAPDAGVRVTGRPPPARRIDAGVPAVARDPGPVADPTAPLDDDAEKATLRDLYQRVGKQLDAAVATHGVDATAGLRRRYGAIAYLEAIRKKPLRAEALTELRALSRELAALK